MRGETEQKISERRGKAEPVSSEERASGRGLSDT